MTKSSAERSFSDEKRAERRMRSPLAGSVVPSVVRRLISAPGIRRKTSSESSD